MANNGTRVKDYLAVGSELPWLHDFGSGSVGVPDVDAATLLVAMPRYYHRTLQRMWGYNALATPARWEPLDGIPYNARFPWATPSAADWRAWTGATPGAWTLASGLSVAYPGNGYAKITWPNDMSERTLVANLTGSSRFDIVARCGLLASGDGNARGLLGFSAVGDTSDLVGLQFLATGNLHYWNSGADTGHGQAYETGYGDVLFVWFWLSLSGGACTLYTSADGLVYSMLDTMTSALSPSKLVCSLTSSSVHTYGEEAFWLDYVALGNSTPAGQ